MAADVSEPDLAGPKPEAAENVTPRSGPPSHPSPSTSPPLQSSVDAGAVRLPAFLRQSKAEIQERFQDLEWLQRSRLLQSLQNLDPTSPWAQEQSYEVKIRNRYLNIQPWANNRIHLKVPSGQCDYINASPIVLADAKTHPKRRYIASQGPRAEQLGHFWRMVWDETPDPAVIVMLTQTRESGKDKCSQYFPDSLDDDTIAIDDEDDSGDEFKATVRLSHIETDATARTIVRRLTLTVGDASKTVWHLLFAAWPDFSIPEGDDRQAMLELVRLSERVNTAPEAPRIVHCSAGVGRSGTFIALDHLLGSLDGGSLADAVSERPDVDVIFETVNRLREQRMTMVQSDAQLGFIYEVLKERWLAKTTAVGSKRDSGTKCGATQDELESQPALISDRGPDVDPAEPLHNRYDSD
ncbi:MAG: hypothetical protein M1815_003940 [Lichina confinis]|nr:MAG: hypothetical protein M1815_003940 [Lichina confinis]